MVCCLLEVMELYSLEKKSFWHRGSWTLCLWILQKRVKHLLGQRIRSLSWCIPAYGYPHKNTLAACALAIVNFLKQDSLQCAFLSSCSFMAISMLSDHTAAPGPRLISLKLTFTNRISIIVGKTPRLSMLWHPDRSRVSRDSFSFRDWISVHRHSFLQSE
jgi:hypothetical protein